MSKMPDYNAIIIFGSKKLWGTFRIVRFTPANQLAVKVNVTKTRKKGKRK